LMFWLIGAHLVHFSLKYPMLHPLNDLADVRVSFCNTCNTLTNHACNFIDIMLQ